MGIDARDVHHSRKGRGRSDTQTLDRLHRRQGKPLYNAANFSWGVEEGGGFDLPVAVAICLAVMDRLDRATLVVSDRGLREGLLDELLGDRG